MMRHLRHTQSEQKVTKENRQKGREFLSFVSRLAGFSLFFSIQNPKLVLDSDRGSKLSSLKTLDIGLRPLDPNTLFPQSVKSAVKDSFSLFFVLLRASSWIKSLFLFPSLFESV
jgi:hypothetical protein